MKSAIIVVDAQSALFETLSSPYEGTAVIARINKLTTDARLFRVPVIFTQHEHPGFIAHASEGWKLCKTITAEKKDIFLRKTAGDAFLNTDLHTQLQVLGVTDLVVCGYASEFCVDSTVRRAVGLGYTVQLVRDAHTTTDKIHLSAQKIREHHNVTLSMSPAVSLK
ncbi:MAG: isochorismatase family protein, partial [Gammaproteobacteria bacterium]|nr:isochorismatase family protein [Gammaproteobacteria bacterium]